MKYFYVAMVSLLCIGGLTNVCAAELINCSIAYNAPNNGTYTRTSYNVSIYTEAGHSKGIFSIYLHNGKKYIKFYNNWICIQGKSRFAYKGNWYIIK